MATTALAPFVRGTVFAGGSFGKVTVGANNSMDLPAGGIADHAQHAGNTTT